MGFVVWVGPLWVGQGGCWDSFKIPMHGKGLTSDKVQAGQLH